MKAEDLIYKILVSQSYMQIFDELYNWELQLNEMLKEIHPDKCSNPDAAQATAKLLEYKHILKYGITLKDEAGPIKLMLNSIKFLGDPKLLKHSEQKYNKIKNLYPSNHTFNKYVPGNFKEVKEEDGILYYQADLSHRVIRLDSLAPNNTNPIAQEHLNWILSRILEFVSYLNYKGYAHNGINPMTVYIVPETHGIIVPTFYHTLKLGSKLNTVSGYYSNFYPAEIFTDKKVIPIIDVVCIKKTILSVMGNLNPTSFIKSGKYHKAFVRFLQTPHSNIYEMHKEYRAMLDKNFPKKFYKLKL